MAKERQAELDCVRGLALVLMLVSHMSVAYAVDMGGRPGDAATFLWAAGETAPAWFFFAFGMTFDHLAGKSWSTVFYRLRLFFYLAIVHNTFVGRPVLVDFLAFLWLAQFVLLLVERGVAPSSRTYVVVFVGVLVSMLAWPVAFWDLWFRRIVPGLFPLLPWGLFVLAGMLYQRLCRERRLWPVGAVLVGLALFVGVFQPWVSWPSWTFAKLVLTAPYVLLLCGIAVLVLEAVRSFPGLYRKIPLVAALLEFLSRNLLLATVLHYVSLTMAHFAYRSIAIDTMREHHRIGVVLSVVCGLVVLLICARAVLFVWERRPRLLRIPEEAVGLVGLSFALGVWFYRQRGGEIVAPPVTSIDDGLAFAFLAVMTRLALGLRSAEAGGEPRVSVVQAN